MKMRTFYKKLPLIKKLNFAYLVKTETSNMSFYKKTPFLEIIETPARGALKTSFRREITKRCTLRTIAEAIIQAKSQKYGRFSHNSRIYERVRNTGNWIGEWCSNINQ